MNDPTESIRREILAEIYAAPGSREHLEHEHGRVWDTAQLQDDFEVLGFAAPPPGVLGAVGGLVVIYLACAEALKRAAFGRAPG